MLPSEIQAIAIPGLAMTAAELPELPGLWRLENPEIGTAASQRIEGDYSAEAVAKAHAATIAELIRQGARPRTMIGMSMGGMILAVLATEHRELFPAETHFRFLATSANTAANPAVPTSLLDAFATARPGDPATFAEALALLFSPRYRELRPDAYAKYCAYRAFGKNGQSAKAYFRQVEAVRLFRGETYFPQLATRSVELVCGSEDQIFPEGHRQDLARLAPGARMRVIDGVGHMVNLEQPELFRP